jgi:hypothetical protein
MGMRVAAGGMCRRRDAEPGEHGVLSRFVRFGRDFRSEGALRLGRLVRTRRQANRSLIHCHGFVLDAARHSKAYIRLMASISETSSRENSWSVKMKLMRLTLASIHDTQSEI